MLSEIELIHARLNVGWNPFTSYRMSHSWAKLQKKRQKLYLKNSGKLTILTYAFSSLTDFNEAHAITEILQMCLKKTCEITSCELIFGRFQKIGATVCRRHSRRRAAVQGKSLTSFLLLSAGDLWQRVGSR